MLADVSTEGGDGGKAGQEEDMRPLCALGVERPQGF